MTVINAGKNATLELKEGRVLVDGKDVTPETPCVLQITGDVGSLVVADGACVVIKGSVGSVMNVAGGVGKTIQGNAVFNAPIFVK